MNRVLLALSLTMFCARNSFAWDEKWPSSPPINSSNVISTYLRASFGKVGEIAAGKLDLLLKDPAMQVKLSESAVNQIKRIFDNNSKSENEKANEFLDIINRDIEAYSTAPTGGIGLAAGYSAQFNAIRLSWNRVGSVNACIKYNCPFLSQSCNDTGSTTVYLAQEASYSVYRITDGQEKLVTTFDAVNRQVGSGGGSWNQTFGFVDFNLSVLFPKESFDQSAKATPFYDFDPYNAPVGQTLAYKVVARPNKCSASQSPVEALVLIDANGDGAPDFYPKDVFIAKRYPGVSIIAGVIPLLLGD